MQKYAVVGTMHLDIDKRLKNIKTAKLRNIYIFKVILYKGYTYTTQNPVLITNRYKIILVGLYVLYYGLAFYCPLSLSMSQFNLKLLNSK